MNRILLIVACWFCGRSIVGSAQSKADAERLAHRLKGDNAPASDNPQCKMFTKAEASRSIGEAIIHVENAALGTGC